LPLFVSLSNRAAALTEKDTMIHVTGASGMGAENAGCRKIGTEFIVQG
jgi:hypothetical protein